jgi:hypothetical protein
MSFAKLRISAVNLLLTGALAFALSACATAPKPEPVPSFRPVGSVETLQSEVSLSVKSGEKSIGGHGYLVFKRPDRFHLAVLSPFGFTLMDVFVSDDLITCLIPAKQTAYRGRVSELPDRNALRGWGMMRWVVDTPPANDGAGAGDREYTGPDGKREILSYDDRGFLKAKSNEDGDRVVYLDYRDRSGVSFPGSIEMSNSLGDTVKIVFDEPEINQPVEEAALTPSLEGVEILPLAAFRGL